MSERQTVLLRATKLGSRWLLEAHHLQTHAEHRFKNVAALEAWLRQTLPEDEEKIVASLENQKENL
jgi:hypothetical protein